MTDRRSDAAPAMERPSNEGGIIWYELMSPDPAASKAFYDAVVGWDIAGCGVRAGRRTIGEDNG